MADAIQITVDFGSEAPWDPSRSGVQYPPDGVYACEITDLKKEVSSAGKTRYEVPLKVVEGEHENEMFSGAIFGDFTKESNRAKLKAALASVGVDPAKLSGHKEFDLSKALVGQKTTVLIKTPAGTDDKGRALLPEVLFIPKSQVDVVKQMYANGGPKKETQTTASSAPKKDLGSLFND